MIRSSNLADERESTYDGPQHENGGSKWKIKSLWIYPIKSCKGVELEYGSVSGVGMEHDRHFSFAQYTTLNYKEPATYGWKFVTQREVPALAKVCIEMWVPDTSSSSYSSQHRNVQSSGVVVIRWPGYSRGSSIWYKILKNLMFSTAMSVQIPYKPTPGQAKRNRYTAQDMTIWKETTRSLLLAYTESWSACIGSDAWIRDLRRFLEDESLYQHPNFTNKEGRTQKGFSYDMSKPFALFRVGSEQPRQVYRNAPRREDVGYQPTVGFQDAYPLHILNLASVHDLASKLAPGAPPLSIKNFRPNIIITGGKPYAEDDWRRIKIGNAEYDVSCRTTRCLMPNVDQSTGKKNRSEPNRTLMEHRRIDKGDETHACLGMQMVPIAEGRREMKVGDEIEVLEVGKHFYIKQ